jgi:hypothetical protein
MRNFQLFSELLLCKTIHFLLLGQSAFPVRGNCPCVKALDRNDIVPTIQLISSLNTIIWLSAAANKRVCVCWESAQIIHFQLSARARVTCNESAINFVPCTVSWCVFSGKKMRLQALTNWLLFYWPLSYWLINPLTRERTHSKRVKQMTPALHTDATFLLEISLDFDWNLYRSIIYFCNIRHARPNIDLDI